MCLRLQLLLSLLSGLAPASSDHNFRFSERVFESEGLGSDPWSWTFWGTETGHSLRRQVEAEASTQTIGAETDFTDDRLAVFISIINTIQCTGAKLRLTFSEDAVTTTTPTTTDDVEIPISIDNNEDNEEQLVDSLEEVIKDLSDLYHDISLDESLDYDHEYSSDDPEPQHELVTTELTTATLEIERTTTEAPLTAEQEALQELQSSHNLTLADMEVLTALLELEKLRGEQQDMMELIENKVNQLEDLLETGDTKQISLPPLGPQLPRGGKTLKDNSLDDKAEVVEASLSLFSNLQAQLVSLLDTRHKFLQDISHKINQELGVLQQTVGFLQRLVNFKLDQGEIFLGKMNPLLSLLQTGTTSVFLMISRFFQAVESVLAMREEFLRAFSLESGESQEFRLFEKIQDLKFNKVLPAKMRLLLNVQENSDELGSLVEQMFNCVREIVAAKIDVIDMTPQMILEAIQTGNLFQLLNFGPVHQTGVPGLSDQELQKTITRIMAETNPKLPLLGPLKPLLVNHKILGMLSGRDRERFVNHYLARKLAWQLSNSQSQLEIEAGQSVLHSHLPALSLGTPCTNNILLGGLSLSATVTRSSRLRATSGLTVYSHQAPSLDLLAHSRLHTNLNLYGSLKAKFGHEIFGRCLPKFSGQSPVKLNGRALVDADIKVIVRRVRIETRKTTPSIVNNIINNVKLGQNLPHLVFNFHLKIDGTIRSFDLHNLRLSGCELKLLGFAMFSNCDLLEKLVRKQVDKMLRETFPLHDTQLLHRLERMIHKRVGDEIAIPLVLTDLIASDGINKVISKTGDLIDLNVRFFNLLGKFSQEMDSLDVITNSS